MNANGLKSYAGVIFSLICLIATVASILILRDGNSAQNLFSHQGRVLDGHRRVEMYERPTSNLFQLSTSEGCSSLRPGQVSPSVAEMEGFRARLSINHTLIGTAINLDCISKIYSRQEIERWTNIGDPVAILTYLWGRRYSNYSRVCEDYEEVMALLKRALLVKVVVDKRGTEILRTPEAYMLSEDFKYQCKGADGGFYREVLIENNVDPGMLIPIGQE